MNISFSSAYNFLMELVKKENNKVSFVCSSTKKRVNQLLDFFAAHSHYSVKRVKLAELAEIHNRFKQNCKNNPETESADYLRKHSPEYIILEDDDYLRAPLVYKELSEIIKLVAEDTAVIVATEFISEFAPLSDEAVVLHINRPNESSLMARASSLKIEDLYLFNQDEAFSKGILLVNNDFFDNFIMKVIDGDLRFCQGDYNKACEAYYDAIEFHNKHSKCNCLVNDFLCAGILIRCIACYTYGKRNEIIPLESIIKEKLNDLLMRLKKSHVSNKYGRLFKEYDMIFLGLKDGWLEKINYLLFINDYAF